MRSRVVCPSRAHLAEELEAFVAQYGAETIAAVIVEPMVDRLECFTTYRLFKAPAEFCDKHNILLIFDEACRNGRYGA